MKVLLVGGNGLIGRAMKRTAPEGVTCLSVGRNDDGRWPEAEAVVHLAHGEFPHEDIRVTAQCLLYARTHGPLLLVSSGAAGRPGVYGATKALEEAMCKGHAIARLYSLIAPDLPEKYALAQFIAQARAGGPVVVESGDTLRSYIWVDEAASRLWSLLDSPGLHIIGGEMVSMAVLGAMVADVFGCESRTSYAPSPDYCYGMPVNVRPYEAIRRCVQ